MRDYSDIPKIAKFLVKHTNTETVVFKWDISAKVYIRYKTYLKRCKYNGAVTAITAMRENTEFVAVYSRLDGIKSIYKIIGVRGEEDET